MGPETVVEWATDHPREILIWTHGVGWALALRRGRIERIFSRLVPGSGADDEASSSTSSPPADESE